MTEETAVRIAEALESIEDAIGLIVALTIGVTISVGIAVLLHIIAKD